jgi:integrase
MWEKRLPMAPEIDTLSKRARLTARKNPYWQGVSGGRGGVSLGYRKPAQGAGSWIAKVVIEGQRVEEKLGTADDDRAGPGALNYRTAVGAALEWGQRQYAGIEAHRERVVASKRPTVRSAVEAYVSARKARSVRGGTEAEGRMKRHVLSNKTFADTPLAKLRATTIEEWRAGLPTSMDEAHHIQLESSQADRWTKELAPATLNRLMNDLRAALNSAAQKHRRELPPYLPAEIKAGTRAVPVFGNARKQLLTDNEVRRIVEAAYEVDESGDFGRLVVLAAATGARFSQLTAITVADVQPARGRIMVPGSRKGSSLHPKVPVAVPVAAGVLDQLSPILRSRDGREPLLQRWSNREIRPYVWEKTHRRPWGPACEVQLWWAATVKRAGVSPDTIMYALRHSSIVRGLRAGLPVRLVAALHDTSSDMIEAHYSAHIIDATEELARRAALSFASGSARLEAAE